MRILVFTYKKPYPLYDGFSLHIYNICKGLSERGHEVYLAYFRQNEVNDLRSEIPTGIVKDVFPLTFPDFFTTTGGYLYKVATILNFTHLTFKPIKYINQEIRRICDKYKIDLIHIHSQIVGLSMVNFHHIPKVLDVSDSMSLATQRQLKDEKNVKEKICRFILFNWLKKIEKSLIQDSEVTTVVSTADKEMLNSLRNDARIDVIPNGIDTDYFSPKNEDEDYPSILFHGNMDFLPNIHAVKYIYNEILTKVKSEIPEIKFFIVGRNPVKEIKNLNEDENVVVTGFVEDIRQYISKASIVFIPMVSGSGIKNKIFEAMAMEKPVVSNPLGAEALNRRTKDCILVGNTSKEMANHILSLLKDKEKRVELGKKGRKVVKEEYSWDKVAEKYERLYWELLKS